MAYDSTLLPDVADARGISSPAIVEKDYFAVELIGLLSRLQLDSHRLVFAGGTSLAKAYQSIYRMSEDVDIKLVPQTGFDGLSRGARKAARKQVVDHILALLNEHPDLSLIEGGKTVRNEYGYTELQIEHPQSHPSSTALRPHLKLDLTESGLMEAPVVRPIRSLYAEALKYNSEVNAFACVAANSTASEKLVALLRRTAHAQRAGEADDDETLIRHVYDLHLIQDELSHPNFGQLVADVIKHDIQRFGNRHSEFVTSPQEELMFGLGSLRDNPVHQERYARFLGPLVYHQTPADWAPALASVIELVERAINQPRQD